MLFEAVHHFWDLVACEGMDLVEVVKALVEVRRMRLVEKSHLPAQHAGKEELLRKKLGHQLQTRGPQYMAMPAQRFAVPGRFDERSPRRCY